MKLNLLFIVFGSLLFVFFLLWFYLINKKFSKTEVLLWDSFLIMISVVVLIMGLQLRNRHLAENRAILERELLQEGNSEDVP